MIVGKSGNTKLDVNVDFATSATTPIAMLPCPFCKRTVHMHCGHEGMNFITCGQRDDGSDGCGAIVSFRPNLRGNEARKAWNKRL